MCFYQIFAHQFNLVTFTRQHGDTNFTTVNCAVILNDFC